MSSVTTNDTFQNTIAGAKRGEDSLRARLRAYLAAFRPPWQAIDRRGDERFPYPRLVEITPVDEDGETPLGAPFVVVGKNLSEQGFGFYHPQPLHYRRVIVALDDECGNRVSVLMQLTWCRFTRYGWYDSGGRFLEIVNEPAA